MVFKLLLIRFVSIDEFTLSTKSYVESSFGRFLIALIAFIVLIINVSYISAAISLQTDWFIIVS